MKGRTKRKINVNYNPSQMQRKRDINQRWRIVMMKRDKRGRTVERIDRNEDMRLNRDLI